MRTTARPPRANRTSTGAFQNEAPYVQLLGDGEAVVACGLALLLALGFPRPPKTPGRGGACLTRHSHDARARLGGMSRGRHQGTTGRAVGTVRPPCVLR